jgi:Xaa-Pro aminopeptidase
MAAATLFAGIPAENHAFYHRIRFAVGDPAAWMQVDDGQSLLIVRDIEMQRAKERVAVQRVACPAEFAPEEGLSSDRATATAQAVAQALRQLGVDRVRVDRSLPYIFAWHVQQAGLALDYDPELGVAERRAKDAQELEWLRAAQRVTEQAMEYACGLIARATADRNGGLKHDGEPLTSERVRGMISVYLLERGFSNHHGSIVASVPDSADCHHAGSGPLRTGQPVIVDIFPQDLATRYWGDCTRTVVHGDPTDIVRRMHAAVLAAKQASISEVRLGSNGDAVYRACCQAIEAHGFRMARGEICDDPVMSHGTGHGIGLEVHEPILLDTANPPFVLGEVVTVEPGLYGRRDGGVRVEDMVAVTADGPENFNRLHEGLDWR